MHECNWLRQVMDDREISIEDMAQVLNLADDTVKAYYYGCRKPSDKVTLNIVKILDLDM